MSQQQFKTMPCPECGAPIPMSIEILLAGQAIHCPNPYCDVAMNVDQNRSRQAIDEVRKLKTALDNFEDTKRKLA
ncbi:MAG: hypothetical protein AAF587_16560 [Bacteroidota bacterium]